MITLEEANNVQIMDSNSLSCAIVLRTDDYVFSGDFMGVQCVCK